MFLFTTSTNKFAALIEKEDERSSDETKLTV